MSDHPYRTDDIHTIQDYLVTKIQLLLASGADDTQWTHQYEAQRTVDPTAWVRQNAFLWDFTLARFIAAAHIKKYDVLQAATPGEQFLEEFVQAVSSANHASALGLWDGMNEFAGGESLLPTSKPLTRRVRELNPISDLAEVARNLPPEYEHPQWVS